MDHLLCNTQLDNAEAASLKFQSSFSSLPHQHLYVEWGSEDFVSWYELYMYCGPSEGDAVTVSLLLTILLPSKRGFASLGAFWAGRRHNDSQRESRKDVRPGQHGGSFRGTGTHLAAEWGTRRAASRTRCRYPPEMSSAIWEEFEGVLELLQHRWEWNEDCPFDDVYFDCCGLENMHYTTTTVTISHVL